MDSLISFSLLENRPKEPSKEKSGDGKGSVVGDKAFHC